MTEQEYAEFVREQRRLALQRVDDLLYDLRCTLWPRSPWTPGPSDPIEREDQERRLRIERTLTLRYLPVTQPANAFRLIAGAL